MLWQPIHDSRHPDPFRTLRALHGLEQLLARPATAAADLAPPLTVYAKDDGCLVRALVPGLAPADIEIEVDGDQLSISGQWPAEPEGVEVVARHAERPTGRFSRRLRLPFEVDAAKVEARMERGVLEIQLARTPDRKARRIEVQTSGTRN